MVASHTGIHNRLTRIVRLLATIHHHSDHYSFEQRRKYDADSPPLYRTATIYCVSNPVTRLAWCKIVGMRVLEEVSKGEVYMVCAEQRGLVLRARVVGDEG